MSFISVLLALLIEQARPLGPGNRVHALTRVWVRWSSRNFDTGQPGHAGLAWGVATVLPALLTLGVYWLLDGLVGWPLALVWSVAILYLTLGFRQFSSYFTQIRDALADGDEALARELLARWQQIDARDLPRSEIVRHAIERSVIAAHRHVFGVLAWYSVLAAFGLGPAGAVLYRLGEFVCRYWQRGGDTEQHAVSEALQRVARRAWYWADWVPARVTAVSFAVVGSFEEAIDGWRQHERNQAGDNDTLILAATAGAVNIRLQATGAGNPLQVSPDPAPAASGQTPELAHLAVIVGLVWRTVVMWIVLLALLTLARLLG
ncbi:MAG: hypothetical protein RIS90_2966 [Pseudomonadota bacterium]|jgi:adenosylcobinamide-phosphate synthase